MKKIIFVLAALLLLCSVDALAITLTDASPDDSFIRSLGRDIAADRAYLKDTAEQFSDRVVVREMPYLDCGAIDRLCHSLSTPPTLTELDSGKLSLTFSRLGPSDYQSYLKRFKVLGGFCGYSMEFEPIGYYSIYRSLSLIGGYLHYTAAYPDPADALWYGFTQIEDLTREVIRGEERESLLEKGRQMAQRMDQDTTFKIFLLKDGEIDSMYERQ